MAHPRSRIDHWALKVRGTLVSLGGRPVTIGRSSSCEVVLDSPRVSRQHARVALTEEGPVIDDLQSANGVMVGGQVIQGRRRLGVGDRIIIGDEVIEVLEDETESRETVHTMREANTVDYEPVEAVSASPPSSGPTESTQRADKFGLICVVADKSIRMGNAAQA